MADTQEVSPATLLDQLASLDPQERRKVATVVRSLSETFTEVPDGRDTAHALPVAGPHPRSELTGAAPSSRVRANTRSGHRERGRSRQRSDTTGRASEREARHLVVL